MTDLSFNDCTLPVGKMCVISSLKAALTRFSVMGRKGYVTLERVTKPGFEQVVWVSRNFGRTVATLPVFENEQPLNDALYPALKPIKDNELLEHKGYFYRTYLNFNNEICIRAVVIFPDEGSVREALGLCGLNVINVELVQFFTIAAKKYLVTGWMAQCLDAEPQFICVDLYESSVLDGIDFGDLTYEPVSPDHCFAADEKWYMLKKDDEGRLYICKHVVRHFRRKAECVYHQELQRSD